MCGSQAKENSLGGVQEEERRQEAVAVMTQHLQAQRLANQQRALALTDAQASLVEHKVKDWLQL